MRKQPSSTPRWGFAGVTTVWLGAAMVCVPDAAFQRPTQELGTTRTREESDGEGMAMAMADGSVHNDGTRCEQYLVRVYEEWK